MGEGWDGSTPPTQNHNMEKVQALRVPAHEYSSLPRITADMTAGQVLAIGALRGDFNTRVNGHTEESSGIVKLNKALGIATVGLTMADTLIYNATDHLNEPVTVGLLITGFGYIMTWIGRSIERG